MFKSNESQNTYDGKIEFHYKICFIMSIVLAVLRIIAFDILTRCGVNYMNKPYHERINALVDLNLEWGASRFLRYFG